MQRYTNNFQDKNGNALQNASVTVYIGGTSTIVAGQITVGGTKASLFSDEAGTVAATNPLFTDANGMFSFCAADGVYDALLQGSGINSQTVLGIKLEDERSVNSIAALKTVTGTALSGYMTVLGYYSAGDGGEGLFFWNSTDLTADNGGTVIAPNAGGTGRWNRLTNGQVLRPKWFGAKGDGTTDDYTAMSNWLTAIAGSSGLITDGTFAVSQELHYNVATSGQFAIFGTGPNAIIKPIGVSNKGLHVSGTAGVTSVPVVLYNFAIQSGTSGTSAAGLHLDGISHYYVASVWVDGKSKMTNGIQCTAAQQGEISGGQIVNCTNGGYVEDNSGGGVRSNGIDWHGMTFVNSSTNLKIAFNAGSAGADDISFHSNHLTSATMQIDVSLGGIGSFFSNHIEGAAAARNGMIVRAGKVYVAGNYFAGTAGTVDLELASSDNAIVVGNILSANVKIDAGMVSTVFAFNVTGGTCTDSGTNTVSFSNHATAGSAMPETLRVAGTGIASIIAAGRILCAGATDDGSSGLQVGNGLIKLTNGNADITSSGNLYLDAAALSAINFRFAGSAAMCSMTPTLITANSGIKFAVTDGGSTTISTGVGSVKMSSVNAATNTAWIPMNYAGSTYFIPAWTTNSP